MDAPFRPRMSEQQTYLTPDVIPRLAAIDIGSNSIRLVVAEAQAGGRYRVLDEERESTRLGRALVGDGALDSQSIEDSLAALRRFKAIIAGLGVESVRAIATCAVREASNGEQFCRRVKDELGLEIEVIDADMEADLAFQSVRRRFDLTGTNTVLADIGGGSTEIILASGELIETIYATKLGAVRLAEKYGSDLSDDQQFNKLKRGIDAELRKTTDKPTSPLHMLIGSGGTFTSLASMIMASRGLSRLPAAGFRATRADVCHLIDRLRKMGAEERFQVPGLNPDRVDIIIPGLAVVDGIMRRFKVNTLQVHVYGVRDGLLLTMIDSLQGTNHNSAPNADEQIDRFTRACGVDLAHAQHVAKLAGEIFAGLCELYELPASDVRLLEAAAKMQDVGYLISYEGHHKHSYHLILHSRLAAFRPEELEIIANVARYHRGAEPKNKHENYSEIDEKDQQRVCQMAAVLRIAGGLDRSHNQTVRAVQVAGAPGQIELTVYADEYPEVDIWACRRRSGMFEKVFGAELTVRWAGQPGAPTPPAADAPIAKAT
jgi:exopolyphosphatase/guanosine-5'-triphosphate,3'-diphosphate pyrophosphatase